MLEGVTARGQVLQTRVWGVRARPRWPVVKEQEVRNTRVRDAPGCRTDGHQVHPEETLVPYAQVGGRLEVAPWHIRVGVLRRFLTHAPQFGGSMRLSLPGTDPIASHGPPSGP